MPHASRFASRAVGIGRIAALLLAPALATAQSARNPAIDRVFAEWDKPTSPGCALGVVQNGKMVYERGYGKECS